MLYVTHADPELLLAALGASPEQAARMRAAREDRKQREAAFKPCHRLRIRKAMRSGADCADDARRLARLVQLRLLPNDPELIAERAFPMDAPHRRVLADAMRERLA